MVVKGNFSVRLVRVVDEYTKEPFKEHVGPDGLTYAEVEPDAEYLVELQVVGGEDSKKRYVFEGSIDDKKLNYISWLCKDQSRHDGIISKVNGERTIKAFKFQRPKLSKSASSQGSTMLLMGSVSYKIYEGVYAKEEAPRDIQEFTTGGDEVSDANMVMDKTVRSSKGRHSETTRIEGSHDTYGPGALVEEIELRYCTTVGLIYCGVLAKPSNVWDAYILMNPGKRRTADPGELLVEPKKIKYGGCSFLGRQIVAPKEADLFDLTDFPDSEPEGTAARAVRKDGPAVVSQSP